jgi:hypothetical protein
MFKVIALIVVGTFLMAFGLHFLLNADLPALVFPFLQMPNVNWSAVGFVAVIGGITVFGTAFAASRLSR